MSRKHSIRSAAPLAILAAAITPWLALGQTPIGLNSPAVPAPSIPQGDFGDAPDGTPAHYPAPFAAVIGNFPTRYLTTNSRYGLSGGYTVNTTQERLGNRISIERGPRDSADPDLIENLVDDDFDDGMIGGPCPAAPPAFPFPPLVMSHLTFKVEIAAAAPAGTRYLNVLLDRNMDGVWSNSVGNTEWIAVDVPVSVAPGTSGNVIIGPLPWPVAPANGWMRVALTRTPIVGTFADNGTGWDGGGTYSHGEIEDYLPVSALAYAADAAGAADSASRFAVSADFAYDFANPPDAFDFALVDVNAFASAVATASASASAAAAASATAVAEANASATAAANAQALAQANATAIAAACVTCPCATLCAAAGANASAAVMAATSARASAETSAGAAATALVQANAQVSVTATAQVDMNLHVTAFAAAYASAQAEALSFAVAQAAAHANASSAASASAAALAAACAGDASAAAAAGAQAAAYASASASALADAEAFASASATAWADARVALQLMIRVRASAQAAASAAAFAGSAASAFASAAAQAEAAGTAAAASLTSGFAMVSAACTGDCCPPTTCTTGDRYRNGTTTSGSSRGTGAATWTLVGVRAGASSVITGFTWQAADAGAGAFAGMSDVAMWPAGVVQGGGANDANPVFSMPSLPTTRSPVVNDCGQPMTMGSAPLFDYSVTLPNPVTVPPGEDLYIAVRGVGSGTYASRVVSAHRDLSGPQMPSYYLAPAQGFPNAVPVSTVLNCDYDFVVHPVGE